MVNKTSNFFLFLVSAYAKIYHEPSAYFSITTFEAKQLVPLGFESGFAAYISRILIALEFSLGFLILLPFQLKRIVVPLTISVLTAFCFHLLIQIYLTEIAVTVVVLELYYQ